MHNGEIHTGAAFKHTYNTPSLKPHSQSSFGYKGKDPNFMYVIYNEFWNQVCFIAKSHFQFVMIFLNSETTHFKVQNEADACVCVCVKNYSETTKHLVLCKSKMFQEFVTYNYYLLPYGLFNNICKWII
jgi:hypothetical protein